MYYIFEVIDTLRIDPSKTGNVLDLALDAIEDKFCGRVLPGAGIFVCVHRLLERNVGAPLIQPGDGHLHVRVTFEALVYGPVPGDVISGVIRTVDAEGISLGLSKTTLPLIRVEKQDLMENSKFVVEKVDKEKSKLQWQWTYEDGEGSTPFLYTAGHDGLLRVTQVSFPNTGAAMKIAGQMNIEGLSVKIWWEAVPGFDISKEKNAVKE